MSKDSTIAWTAADSIAALAEGWDVFASDTYGTEIERYDEAEIFDSDYAALVHVRERAAAGSDMHRRALAMHDEGRADLAQGLIGSRYEFRTERYRNRKGPIVVTVTRQMTDDEVGAEAQPVFEIRAEDGWTATAWPSELTYLPA